MNNLKIRAKPIRQERDPLLSRWRERVRQLPSARDLDTPTLNDHVPQLLDEIAAALEEGSDETIAEAVAAVTPTAHGVQRADEGFDIVEVVAEYNILRGCIHDLADQNDVSLRGQGFHILNRVMDGAIGLAVQTFATRRALDVQRRREEHLAFVAHDLKTPLNAISVAAKVLEHELADGVSDGNSRMLRILSRNADNLGKLITEVLKENANLESGAGIKLERRRFELWPFVERLIHDMNLIAGTGSVLPAAAACRTTRSPHARGRQESPRLRASVARGEGVGGDPSAVDDGRRALGAAGGPGRARPPAEAPTRLPGRTHPDRRV